MKKNSSKPTVTQLHKKAWKVFSEYIRLRDCLKTTGFPDRGVCITCGVEKPYALLDAGHFVTRSAKDILYDERNVNAQCKSCNNWGNGEQYKYGLALTRMYGAAVVKELQRRKYVSRHWKTFELEELIEEYKGKIVDLAANQP